jgi:hypothetical protein
MKVKAKEIGVGIVQVKVDDDANPAAIRRLIEDGISITWTSKMAYARTKTRYKTSRSIPASLYGPDWQNARHIGRCDGYKKRGVYDFRRSAYLKPKRR